MIKAVFDTNIIIDYLNGVVKAKNELDSFEEKSISIITYMEVMVGLKNQSLEMISQVKSFLEEFSIFPIDYAIAKLAIAVRQKYSIKLPDAIIFATAQYANALLVTRNTRDFPEATPSIRIPYHL